MQQHNLKQGELTIIVYLQQMKAIIDDAAQIGWPLPFKDLMSLSSMVSVSIFLTSYLLLQQGKDLYLVKKLK